MGFRDGVARAQALEVSIIEGIRVHWLLFGQVYFSNASLFRHPARSFFGRNIRGPEYRSRAGGGCSRMSPCAQKETAQGGDRKSTRLNSSHQIISYAVFCLKK